MWPLGLGSEPRAELLDIGLELLIGIQADLKPVPITGTIAYIANSNAWVMQTTSPNQRRLTFTSDLDGQVFALSPDGFHLLFTRGPTETGESAPFNTLWMIETVAADAEPVRLEAENVLWADWAPECEGEPTGTNCRIAYTTGVPSEGSLGWKAENDLRVVRPRASDGRLFRERVLVEPSAGGTYGWWGTTYAWSHEPAAVTVDYPTTMTESIQVSVPDVADDTVLTFKLEVSDPFSSSADCNVSACTSVCCGVEILIKDIP